MVDQERIPGGDGTLVDQNAQAQIRSLQVAVKHHRQVLFDPVDEVEKVLLAKFGRDDPVQHLPQHQRALRLFL
jgi:hypothetical protein